MVTTSSENTQRLPGMMKSLCDVGELAAWKTTPQLVATRYKEARQLQSTIQKVVKHLPTANPGYGMVYWNPESKSVWAVLSEDDSEQVHQRWYNSLKAINGVQDVRTEKETVPNQDDWVLVKRSASLSWLNTPYQLAGKPVGGPSPLSNAIVSSLLGAGAGYAGGALAENLLPEKYVARGRLRKNLAMAGAAGGAAIHVPQLFANAGINRAATGDSHWWRSAVLGDQHQNISPDEKAMRDNFYGTFKSGCEQLPDASDAVVRAASKFTKMAFNTGAFGGDVPLTPVPVDAFNRAIWNDVHNGANASTNTPYGKGTPPANAAAASGLVTGVQQMYGNPSTLSPRHFINGLAHAGVDLMTANVAGKVLGTLGGLTPDAQQQLQNMGLWGGMIRGVTSSVLGLR